MTERIRPADIPQGLYSAMGDVEAYLKTLPFDPGLLELVRLRAAQLNGCAYCVEMHHLEAAAAGESEQRLYALCVWKETPFFSDKERALLAWTEKVTLLADNEISDELMAQMQQHFSQKEIANLTLAIAQTNSWNRLGKTFGMAPGRYKVGMHG
ncbi:carboxymuconolactone decarboxylase family protein [Sedimenticola sp.]|uniref:carboxymuconolactone decarboxylase family protein n=1 Tax=Sedimenticola sp. TaxID=1940285 RepID=UPI003D0C0141